MSRSAPVIRREFRETVTSRAYFIGTALGPLLIIGLFAMQFLLMGSAGEHRITILDGTAEHLGDGIRAALENPPPAPSFISRPTFHVAVEPVTPGARAAAVARLQAEVSAERRDGFLWVPPGILAGDTADYEGSNATNTRALEAIKE